MRGPSGLGARRLARAGVLEQYVEHGLSSKPSISSKPWCSYRVLRPSGGEKCRLACKVLTNHETRLLPGARRKPARIPRFSRNTRHESRITAFFRITAFPVARLVPVGTEALQSCFFRSGMLGIRREEPFLRSRNAKIRGANVSNEKG